MPGSAGGIAALPETYSFRPRPGFWTRLSPFDAYLVGARAAAVSGALATTAGRRVHLVVSLPLELVVQDACCPCVSRIPRVRLCINNVLRTS